MSPTSLPAVIADAVRSTEAGSQTGGGFVVINIGATVAIVSNWLETGVTCPAQGSLLVIITDTVFPLVRLVVVKVGAVCPATFTPLIIH